MLRNTDLETVHIVILNGIIYVKWIRKVSFLVLNFAQQALSDPFTLFGDSD